jgi:signal transduction histidine kinase
MSESMMIAIGAVTASFAFGLVLAVTAFIGRVAFQVLPEEQARLLLRRVFPIFYMLLFGASVIGGAALALPRPVEAGILAAVAFTTLFAWTWLMPIAHRMDDLQRSGEEVRRELMQTQGRTTFIVVAQIAALMTVVIRLAIL